MDCGVYVRDENLEKARVIRSGNEPCSLTVTFVLKEPARVSIYTETGNHTRGNFVRQIVIVAEPAGPGRSAEAEGPS